MKALALDLETTKDHKIACVAIQFSDHPHPVRIYEREGEAFNFIARQLSGGRLSELILWLQVQTGPGGYRMITWGGAGFDLKLMAELSGMYDECRRLAREHVDMMFGVLSARGYPVALKAACIAHRIECKPDGFSGADVPDAWEYPDNRAGIIDYCVSDAAATLRLYRESSQLQGLNWISKSGTPRTLLLPHGWRTVEEALRTPEPDTSWMTEPQPRSKYTGWLAE